MVSGAIAAGITVAFVSGPLLLAMAGGWPGRRDFVSELGSGLGIVALGLLGLLLLLPSRLGVFKCLGADVAVRLHRRLASGFAAVLIAHVAIAVAAHPIRIALLQFINQPWRAQAAIGSTVAFTLLVLSSLGRRRLGLPYVAWRVAHAALAVAAMLLAVLHTIGWGRYLTTGVGILGLVAVGGAPVLAVVLLRVGRHRALRRVPYVVERVSPERGGTATVQLRADGHAGHPFRPGQFAWLKLAEPPLGVDEHPFSYSSSALHPDRPSFTIRAYGGFSALARELAPGTPILVDGPHGAFRPSRDGAGMALIANGIGITPMMSILRTAADRGEQRRYVLVYGNRDAAGITFCEELDALEHRLALDVVHVLSRPSMDWTGLRGRITASVLRQSLPADLRGWEFFLCGSGAAVDSSLIAIDRIGVPPECVHAERFVEV